MAAGCALRPGSFGSGSSATVPAVCPLTEANGVLCAWPTMVSPQSGQNFAVMGDRCPLLQTLLNFWPHVVHTAAVSSATLT